MHTANTAQLCTKLRERLAAEEPRLNRSAVCAALGNFLCQRTATIAQLPDAAELATYLARLTAQRGAPRAATEFAYLQIAAARLWGAAETAHFGQVLRTARTAQKARPKSEWEQAEAAIAALPAKWQDPMLQHLALSRDGGRAARGISRWSASHLASVARALACWIAFCDVHGLEPTPTGSTLDHFASWIMSSSKSKGGPVSLRTAADYVSRINSAFAIVLRPGFASSACAFVIRDLLERAAREECPRKLADQIVSASALYKLGFELMERAQCRRTRGLRAALEFRNGILLAVGIALPQRARALSVLARTRTFQLLGEGAIRVFIPGEFIKQREGRKASNPYEIVFHNRQLHNAVEEYLRDFRPLFDDGDMLFPSKDAPGNGITSKQIGRITGDLTLARFGVRISIHRLRDNVATEICETMPEGGRLAPIVLGHRDPRTTARHYDHSQGHAVASEFGELLEDKRSAPTALAI